MVLRIGKPLKGIKEDIINISYFIKIFLCMVEQELERIKTKV